MNAATRKKNGKRKGETIYLPKKGNSPGALPEAVVDYLWEMVERRCGQWRCGLGLSSKAKVVETVATMSNERAERILFQLRHIADNAPHEEVRKAVNEKLRECCLD